MNTIWLRLVIVLVLLSPASFLHAQSDSMKTEDAAASEQVPESAHFSATGLEEGEQTIVGRLSLRRQFLGTRATPAFRDSVQFHCFDGSELRFVKFSDADLESQFAKQLSNGYEIPVMITAVGKQVTSGHDGINQRIDFTAKILKCETLTPEAFTAAAESVGYKEASIKKFEAALKPDAISKEVAVSIEQIYVRSKESRQGSAVSFIGIEVFNPLTESASVKINSVSIEQDGKTQECQLSKRSKAPISWEIDPESWSDGVYEAKKMPIRIWAFEPAAEIEPNKKVTVNLEIEINDEAVTVTKLVNPK